MNLKVVAERNLQEMFLKWPGCLQAPLHLSWGVRTSLPHNKVQRISPSHSQSSETRTYHGVHNVGFPQYKLQRLYHEQSNKDFPPQARERVHTKRRSYEQWGEDCACRNEEDFWKDSTTERRKAGAKDEWLAGDLEKEVDERKIGSSHKRQQCMGL